MNLSSFFAAERTWRRTLYFEPESVLEIRKELDKFYSDLTNKRESVVEALSCINEAGEEERAEIASAVEFAFSTLNRDIFQGEQRARLMELIKGKYGGEPAIVKYILLILKHLLDDKESLEFNKAVFGRFGFSTASIEVMAFVCRISSVELRECFDAWRKNPNIIRFLGESKREELKNEVTKYFVEFPEEQLEGDVIAWFVQWIQKEAKEIKNFNNLIEKVKKRVESVRRSGMALYDVTVLNYTLGNVRRCFFNEKDD